MKSLKITDNVLSKLGVKPSRRYRVYGDGNFPKFTYIFERLTDSGHFLNFAIIPKFSYLKHFITI